MEDHAPFNAGKRARIEIIPLIDVVFFLLATFVLFTLSLEKIRSLPVLFPKAGEPISTAGDQTLYLRATEHGLFHWQIGRDGSPEQLTHAELSPRLESYRATVPNPRVLINGDDRVPFSATIEALDAVRLARISQVSMETARP